MADISKVARVDGIVEEASPGLLFRVKTDSGKKILAHPAGKLKIHHIRVIPGDRVTLVVPKSGRSVWGAMECVSK